MTDTTDTIPQGMKAPKYAAMTIQKMLDGRINAFAMQLMGALKRYETDLVQHVEGQRRQERSS